MVLHEEVRGILGLRSLLSAGQSSSTTPNLINHVLEQEGENPQISKISRYAEAWGVTFTGTMGLSFKNIKIKRKFQWSLT